MDMEENDIHQEGDFTHVIEDAEDPSYMDVEAGTIEAYVMERFHRAEQARENSTENRWLNAYRNFRGVYGPDVQFTEAEKSRVFIKVTKTKALAAYGQITDILFGGNQFPLSIKPTKLPEGVEDSLSLETDPNLQMAKSSNSPQDTKLLPGETMPQQKLRLGALKSKLAPVEGSLVKGTGDSPTAVTFHPAEVAAKKMEKTIFDQLEESSASKELRLALYECVLFGTGIIKGPFAKDKEYPNWDEQGNYAPIIKTIPQVRHTSVWNFYPDPDANFVEEAEFTCEVHPLSKSRMFDLLKRPGFRETVLKQVVSMGPDYIKEHWEQVMEEDETSVSTEKWKVIEFWGNVDTELLTRHGIEVPSELEDRPQLSVNIWVCRGKLLRCLINPFTPSRLPYHVVPYEVNPYSLWGVGLCENMEDTQTLMNGFLRMAVDNAALSGNLVFEVDETNLSPGQDLTKIYPGKIFKRQGGAPGQALFGTQFPNVSNQNLQLFDKARQLADESTGLPSFSHGQTGVSGVGRTSSGISMLMSAANVSVATVVKNIDDFILQPLGKAFFHFNMQFNFDPEIKGDLEVRALGTESLMADEVRSQRLLQFLGTVQNPMLAAFPKMDYIIREIAKSLKLDPEKVVNSMSDAAIQAELLKKMQPEQPAGPPPQEGIPEGGPTPSSIPGTGGGNIGTSAVPSPGQKGFTGNEPQAAG